MDNITKSREVWKARRTIGEVFRENFHHITKADIVVPRGKIFNVIKDNREFELELLSIDIGIGANGLEEYKGVYFGKEFRKCKRLYPYVHGTEGFFIAKLRKK